MPPPPGIEPWNIAAGELRQQIVLQTQTVGSSDSRGKPTVTWPDTITAASWATNVATFTIAGTLPATFIVGSSVTVSGMRPTGYNGTFTVASVTAPSTFAVAMASNPGTAVNLGSITCDPAPGTLVRCKIEPLTGRKAEIARQLVPSASHLVTIRGPRTINEKLNRLVYKSGRVLNIGNANDIEERHVRLELTCTEEKP